MLESVNIPMSLLQDKRLSLNDVRVFAALFQLADGLASCSASIDKIRQLSGVSQVSRHTKNLARFGYIGIDHDTYTIAGESGSENERTLSSFAKEFLEYSSGVHTKKTTASCKTAFNEFVRVEGDRDLNTIGIREIEHFLAVKKAEASPWTSRKYFLALRAAFEKAVQWNLLKENPFGKVKKPKVAEVLPAFFTEKDFEIFLLAIDDRNYRELYAMAILTGMRLGELLNLRWSDIDFSSKRILIQNSESFTTKSKRSRVVPISEDLLRLLTDRKENIRTESDLAFPNSHGRKLNETVVERKFKKAVRRAGLNEKLHFHSLRHSFASALVMSGVSLYAVQKLLGHSSSKTTEIYSHLLPQQTHGEVNTLAAKFYFYNNKS